MTKVDFNRLSMTASAYLNQATFGRIAAGQPADIMEKVKDACCAIADAYLLNEQGGGVASESNDGITVSYVTGISTAKNDNQRLREAASLFLGDTGLLYRGVG